VRLNGATVQVETFQMSRLLDRPTQITTWLFPESEDENTLAPLLQWRPLDVAGHAISRFVTNNDLLWASALTYTTSLSIVPVLALALSAVQAFGGAAAFRPIIERYLAVNSPVIADQLLGLVSNVNAKTLSSIGGATLLITAIATLSTVENAFNFIFQAPRGRTYLRKFSDYLSVTFTLPLILVAANSVRNHISAELPNVALLGWAVSNLMVWAGFLFLYIFFPNTHVRWRSALIGSFVAAVLLQIAQGAYLNFQYGFRAYRAFYGALATIPLLLVWIYMNWAIVLFGGEVVVAVQRGPNGFNLDQRSPNFLRAVTLLVGLRLAERMRGKVAAVSSHSLSAELGVSEHALMPIVRRLIEAGLIVEAAGGGAGAGLFLAREPSHVTLHQLFEAAGAASKQPVHGDERVMAVMRHVNHGESQMLGSITLEQLLEGARDLLRDDEPPSQIQAR
jgi:membrane protein